MKTYSGNIVPGENIIFVFGSNPEGRHGAGAAKTAREQFGAVYGKGEGLQGHSYGLPTKDLRIKGYRSISKEDIIRNIRRLYACAILHQKYNFCIAYRNVEEKSLNGYTGIEMINMFINAAGGKLTDIPSNIVVSQEWANYITNKFNYKFE